MSTVPETPNPQATAKPRVMVVEDQPDLLRLIPRVLSSRGYEVKAAGSAEEALTMLEAAHADGGLPQMLLTDLSLPTMDGTSLAREVRGRWGEMKIGFMSGYDSVSEFDAQEFGHIPLLDKPFTIEGLMSFLEGCLTPAD